MACAVGPVPTGRLLDWPVGTGPIFIGSPVSGKGLAAGSLALQTGG